MTSILNMTARRSLGDRVRRLARKLGCRIFERKHRFGAAQPAVVPASEEVAKQLSDFGGLWCSREKAMIFPTWAALEGVLDAIMRAPPAVAVRSQRSDET